MQHSPRFLRLVEETKKNVTEISVQEAARRMKEPGTLLIDVREESEWQAGHAAGAVYLGRGIIERDIENRVPDANTPILCYCGGGFRSALAADNLQKMGYTNVSSVAGGFKAWQGANLPTSMLPEVLPRSPYEKLGGIVHIPRLIDKARLYPQGKLPGYNYMNTGLDKYLLDFLCVDATAFEQAARQCKDDLGVLIWLKETLGPAWPGDHTVREFNDKMIGRKPDTPEKQQLFDQIRARFPATRKRIETVFDLIDLEEGRLN